MQQNSNFLFCRSYSNYSNGLCNIQSIPKTFDLKNVFLNISVRKFCQLQVLLIYLMDFNELFNLRLAYF